jgi:hypothetical protein
MLSSVSKLQGDIHMDSQDSTTTKQVTVDVPEDRIAEFHAFFARFLSGRRGPGRGGRGRGYGRHPHRSMHGHRHGHGRHCGPRDEAEGQQPTAESTQQTAGTTAL